MSTVRNAAINLKEEMEASHVDRAMGLLPQLNSGFVQRRLFLQRCVCLFRRGHWLDHPRRITLAEFAAAEHVVVVSAGTGHGKFDALLERRGVRHNVRLTVPHFVAVGPTSCATRTWSPRSRSGWPRVLAETVLPGLCRPPRRAAGNRDQGCSGTPRCTSIRPTSGASARDRDICQLSARTAGLEPRPAARSLGSWAGGRTPPAAKQESVMSAPSSFETLRSLETVIALARLLERVEAGPVRVDAGQYRALVRQLAGALAQDLPDAALQAVLGAHPAAAELYENLHYAQAGLSRSTLERSVATEMLAAQVLAKAARRAD